MTAPKHSPYWILALALMACSESRPVTYRVEVQSFVAPTHTKFFADGQEIKQIRAPAQGEASPQAYYVFEVAGQLDSSDSRPQVPPLTVELLRPCGWHKAQSRYELPQLFEVEQALRENRLPVVKLWFREDDASKGQIELLIDNRKGSELRIALGMQEAEVAAGELEFLYFPPPDCAEGRVVHLNGREVARIEGLLEASGKRPASRLFLLDPSGSRCYRMSDVAYTREDAPSYSPTDSQAIQFRQKLLHELPRRPDFLIGAAPPSVQIQVPADKYPSQLRRTQLVEVPCR